MKKLIFVLGIVFILLLINASAQIDSADQIADAQVADDSGDESDVGIAPDSPFYGLENAFKKISLALTFGKEAKARKELKIARERLKEVKLMIERNKIDAAEKAKARHEEISEKLKLRFENEVDADDKDVELQAEIENEIEEQEDEIEGMKTRIEIKGELTEEQRAKLMEFVDDLKSNGNDVRLKIDARKDRLKVKLKEEGLTEIEIEDKIEKRKETGLDNALRNRIEHVKREIEKSRGHLSRNKNSFNNEVLNELRGQLDTSEETLAEAAKKLEEKEYDDAKELITKALKLAVLVRGNEKRFESNREILKEELKKELGEERLERAREKLIERKEELKEMKEKVEERKKEPDEKSDDEDETEEEDKSESNEELDEAMEK